MKRVTKNHFSVTHVVRQDTARDCRMKSMGGLKRNEKEEEKKNGMLELRCFNCGGGGHMSMK